MNAVTRHLASDGHVVGFYRDDRELVAQVAEYLIEGLTRGRPALVVATVAHRHQLEERLAVQRIDGESMGAAGRLRFVDAAETLSQFMVDGSPDVDRFAAVVRDLIDHAGSRRVRVSGEMVQLLWEAGHVNAAMRLESLWNDLAGERDFSLFCACRSDTVCADPDAREALCRLHTAVVGSPPKEPAHAVNADNIAAAELAPSSDAPTRARRLVAEALRQWGWTGDHQAALLIATELSANAVVHARSPLRVCVTRRGNVVRISVADLHPGRPILVRPSPHETSGRGLGIVAALADRWGHDIDISSKEVWAEIHAGRGQV
jgi:anti-sigma regulatory factor (Ser/Thr protein kinase)